jgi:hypothetical protein
LFRVCLPSIIYRQSPGIKRLYVFSENHISKNNLLLENLPLFIAINDWISTFFVIPAKAGIPGDQFYEIPAVQPRWLPASKKQDVSIMLAFAVATAGMTEL